MLSDFIDKYKGPLMGLLKKKFFKLALAKIAKLLGRATLGGFYGWVASFILEYLWDEVGEPMLKAGMREIGYGLDKVQGKYQVHRLKKAREEGDHETYDDVIDDIVG